MLRSKSRWLVLVAVLVACQGAFAGLKEYVAKPDDSYAYKVDKTEKLGENPMEIIRMTSQTWEGIQWNHWLSMAIPATVKHGDTAIIIISGGDNTDEAPSYQASFESQILSMMVENTGSVAAVLNQVPNQPLFGDLKEDALISYTYEQYYKTGDEDWPLLLPMTKSVVRAMDTIQTLAKEKYGLEIKNFVVGGASKRGWTTWLTGAADPRVTAIVPAVIDVLHMGPQMEHQLKCYGTFSDMINDYTERGMQQLMSSPEGKKLLGIIDPYSYISGMMMPKLVLLGTNDPYWTVDAANFYFPELKGEKHLRYEPNAGHGLGPGIIPAALAFYTSMLTGQKIPEYSWKHLDDGGLEVTWDCPEAKANLWQAQSPTRDFRQAVWTSTPLEGNGTCVAKVDAPAEGWTAYYVELVFPAFKGGMSYGLCTQMTVVPDTLPHEDAVPAKTE